MILPLIQCTSSYIKFSFSPTDETPKDEEEEQWKDTPSEVVHLSDDTFDDYLAANPSVLVMFYAPCK